MDLAGMQDRINSIKIPVGIEVTLYHDEFSGLEQTYKGPYERAEITQVNNVSSMRVKEYKIELNVRLFKTNSANRNFH
jgi:hypothetical protein